MKLKYRILWIENDDDWVESIEDQIQDYLDDLGFTYEKTLIGKEEVGIDYNLFDLILMDLNLADQPNGAELISKIRDLGAYTDVVFYSASGINELRAKGREKELEGVYFSGRTPDSSFISKVKAVIDSTIKKIQDLNNVRGLVMAEVSELDERMLSIIDSYFIAKATDEKTSAFKKHLVEDVEKSIKRKLKKSELCDKKCKHRWNDLPIEDIMKDFEFDASRKAHAVNLVIGMEGIPYESKYGQSFIDDYQKDMLSMRNKLAHCVSCSVDGKECLMTKEGSVIFDDKTFNEMRKQIKSYNAFLDVIEDRINRDDNNA